MRVLQLISSSVGYYGAERVCVTLAAELEQIGVHNVVGAFRNCSKAVHLEVLDRAAGAGLRTEEITCRGRMDRSAISAICGLTERYKIDVIHCHGIKPNLYAYLAARRRRVALISTCHTWHITSAESWLVSMLDRCTLHGMDRVVLVSDHMKPQTHRFGVRSSVIYNGIDLKPFLHLNPDGSGHGQALRQKMNWRDKPVIGAIGRLAPEKGLKYLLRAAAGVIQEYPNAQFVLAGDGPDRLSLEAEAKSLGIQNSVSFLGIREDIPDLLSAIDVLAMPSLSEGLPMTLLEGMASGRAVVASAVGSIPCAIRDGVDGILCSAGDADSLSRSLRDLLKSRELRTTLGRNARATVESRFSAASMAGQYAQVYDEMTSVRGPTAGL